MQADSDLVALVDDLLRTDPRLLAAAALVGKVAVVVTEPKPERVRKGTTKKRPPPRVGVINGNARVGDDDLRAEGSGPLDGPLDDSPKPAAAPWLKVAKAGKVGDAIRAAIGGQWLAVVTVDGGLWGKLRGEDQRRALVLALRGLRHEEREDGSDKVAREAPPLQCWPDTADDLSNLVAALGVDGAEGAAAVSAAESLTERVPVRSRRVTLPPGTKAWLDTLPSESESDDDEVCSFIHDEDGGPEENEGQA